MTHKAIPPRVQDEQLYWSNAPPSPSERCTYWLKQIEKGWHPNRRLRCLGYHEASMFYGVYVWEYNHVLLPAFYARERPKRS